MRLLKDRWCRVKEIWGQEMSHSVVMRYVSRWAGNAFACRTKQGVYVLPTWIPASVIPLRFERVVRSVWRWQAGC